ncbi:PREDICTED: dynein heavy chain 2, axonemal-like [Eufriesea mexicana]|uniref:dynein heavy chain 2, axonemal-like n=1 Tax=Eufriesea mexicana TaxID=516756 RepID=UPI00083C783D|nr:PREDICTED: dynein heavy chain 2, axonemal-like [Eufriesea mexicana]
MNLKREQKSEILKRSDKMIDSHREFLDMDTDEEEFGHEEPPEIEEELPIEPEKPIFSKEDLIALVKYVKDLTIYPCNGISWNEHSDKTIQEYFKNPTYTVLTTFYDKNELNAMLNIPIHASKGFTYFLRSSWQIYTAENFLNTVSFGSINNNIKNSILKFMENIYAPIVLHSDDYASFLRNDVVLNLHKFITHLMEEIYKPIDLTILYVPKECLLETFLRSSDKDNNFLMGTNQTMSLSEEDERKRKLISRLEKVVQFWIRQIRKATTTSITRKVKNIQDEVNYWNTKKGVENSVTEALLLILFIWTESPFYSTKVNMETLCQALSSQIMEECKKYIKLDVAFGNNPEVGIQMLEKCIFCCDVYKTIYDNIMINTTFYTNLDKIWDVNKQEVFNKIDIFKQRCYDVIEICKTLIVFGRDSPIGLIGGPNGTEYETYWREIESLFYESLDEVISDRVIIFNVSKSTWLKKIEQFRYMIQQLENMTINLINDIFENIKNIEEGIEAIYALRKFRNRKSLRDILQIKWTKIWEIFNNEIEHCYINAIDQSKQKADIDVNLLCISQYLRNQYFIIINALDWIGDCELGKYVLQQYEHVLDIIDKRRKMFNIYNLNLIQ